MAIPKKRRWLMLLGIVGGILGATFILYRVFVYEPFRIPSNSMVPNLMVGDYIMVYKWPYGRYGSFGNDFNIESLKSSKPKRGEVFVFDFPLDPKLSYVARVIGLSGDRIHFDGNDLIVNGVPVKKKQLAAFSFSRPGKDIDSGYIHQETNEGVSYKVFLDRGGPARPATGEVVVPIGHYFMMGDNRDNAYDSRYWGFVPEANIIGKAALVLYSANKSHIGPITP